MSRIYKANAYGKINLHLDVLNKMSNGYHNVESVMQSVSLCDTITLEVTDIGTEDDCEIEISVSDSKLPNDKTNIVYKCANKFIERLNAKGKKFAFTIEKHIPIAAGMAGGSSDGATAMMLLNEEYSDILSLEEMRNIGALVGADIPFCLTGGTCLCGGIGDKITPLPSLKDIHLVSAIDYSSVSTPIAFAMLDEKYGTECNSSKNICDMVTAIKNNDKIAVANLLFNKFENVIIPKNNNIQRIKEIMLSCGAIGTLMSGSGPSVFGIFLDEISQKNALEELKNCSINAFLCKTI